MQAIVAAFLVITPLITSSSLAESAAAVSSGTETMVAVADTISMPIALSTESRFVENVEEETEAIPFETIFEEDEAKELGYQEVKKEGVEGSQTLVYKSTYWNGERIGRELVDTKIIDPEDEIVIKGTKVLVRALDTEEGDFNYTRALTVWSTSYDGNCIGCSGRTATGKSVTHGICAVDPTVIPLGTKFYVPGYGYCSAEDTGGAIKGDKIDVGFEDVRQGWWSARFVEIYLP
jgi:3D (Asp-Asp-Asp) domain-containing protein